MAITITGKSLKVHEKHRTYTFQGLGVEWENAGYGVALLVKTPSGTLTYYECEPVVGQATKAYIPINTLIYTAGGKHSGRLIAHLGDPSNTADIALQSDWFPLDVGL